MWADLMNAVGYERFAVQGNVQCWTEMPSCGHFVAAEEPERLAKDIRAFFKQFRK